MPRTPSSFRLRRAGARYESDRRTTGRPNAGLGARSARAAVSARRHELPPRATPRTDRQASSLGSEQTGFVRHFAQLLFDHLKTLSYARRVSDPLPRPKLLGFAHKDHRHVSPRQVFVDAQHQKNLLVERELLAQTAHAALDL